MYGVSEGSWTGEMVVVAWACGEGETDERARRRSKARKWNGIWPCWMLASDVLPQKCKVVREPVGISRGERERRTGHSWCGAREWSAQFNPYHLITDPARDHKVSKSYYETISSKKKKKKGVSCESRSELYSSHYALKYYSWCEVISLLYIIYSHLWYRTCGGYANVK